MLESVFLKEFLNCEYKILFQERELEQKLKDEEEKRLTEIEEENKRKQQAFMEKLEQFLSGDSNEPPPELLVSSETKPSHELCPFFVKTGCCRFGNQCSRNHQFPGISKVRHFYPYFFQKSFFFIQNNVLH